MSEENVENVRRGIDAWNRGDLDDWLAVFDSEAELHTSGRFVDLGVYRGRAGLERYLSEIHEDAEEVTLSISDLRASGDRVFQAVTGRGRGKRSKVPFEQPIWFVTTVRDGLAVRVGESAAAPVKRGTVRCSARARRAGGTGWKRLNVRAAGFRKGWARCAWRVPAASAGRRLQGSISVTVAGATVRKRFAFRVGSRAALAGPRARSAATAGPLRYGTLGCQPPDPYNPFFKTVIAWSPEVAAVDLTTGTDAEYVWWITRVWENRSRCAQRLGVVPVRLGGVALRLRRRRVLGA